MPILLFIILKIVRLGENTNYSRMSYTAEIMNPEQAEQKDLMILPIINSNNFIFLERPPPTQVFPEDKTNDNKLDIFNIKNIPFQPWPVTQEILYLNKFSSQKYNENQNFGNIGNNLSNRTHDNIVNIGLNLQQGDNHVLQRPTILSNLIISSCKPEEIKYQSNSIFQISKKYLHETKTKDDIYFLDKTPPQNAEYTDMQTYNYFKHKENLDLAKLYTQKLSLWESKKINIWKPISHNYKIRIRRSPLLQKKTLNSSYQLENEIVDSLISNQFPMIPGNTHSYENTVDMINENFNTNSQQEIISTKQPISFLTPNKTSPIIETVSNRDNLTDKWLKEHHCPLTSNFQIYRKNTIDEQKHNSQISFQCCSKFNDPQKSLQYDRNIFQKM